MSNLDFLRRRDALLFVVVLAAVGQLWFMQPNNKRFITTTSTGNLSGDSDVNQEQNNNSTNIYAPLEAALLNSSHGNSTRLLPLKSKKKEADWFRLEEFLENPFTENCWHVEDICHSANRWFYDPLSKAPERQPPFSLQLSPYKWAGRENTVIVEAPNPNTTIRGQSLTSFVKTCQRSPIPNHVVFHGFYNGMLGEFYSRTIPWLHLMQESIAKPTGKAAAGDAKTNEGKTNTTGNSSISADEEEDQARSFLEQTQMYLHILSFPQHGKLLDSHHVFTDAFRSNPLLSITSLLDNARCQCLKRLLMCGYREIQPVGPRMYPKRMAMNTSVSIALEGDGAIGPTAIIYSPLYATAYRDARMSLRQQTIDSNPFIGDDIEKFRADVFLQVNPLLNRSQVDVSAFRIVGLTQRNQRRRFLNLNDLVRQCNTEWFADLHNVVCIEVNVEKDDVHPVKQIVMHAACDMVIGIHGAQLTEAIWMKDGSTVVELLPWIPPKGYGLWTRTLHGPSPLGEMFHETQLNHIGFPLQRDSAPYCEEVTNETEYRTCIGKYVWSDRDYQVKAEDIKDMVTKFLTNNITFDVTGSPMYCDDWQRRAGDKHYVLYNIYCKDRNVTNELPSAHHWYWPKLAEEE